MNARQKPPIDRHTPRLGHSPSGGALPARPRTIPMRQEARYDATASDRRIHRDRWPFFKAERAVPPGNGWVDWTRSGPRRPTLHMSQASWRIQAGTDNSRFPTADTPTGGLHSTTKQAAARTARRFQVTPQMTSTGMDRLFPGAFNGATFSQITQVVQ